MAKRTTSETDGEGKTPPTRYGNAALRFPGPMSPMEKAELLAVAEELRARHIDATFWLRKLFIDPAPPKKRGRKPKGVVEAFRDEQRLERFAVALRTLQGIHRGELRDLDPAMWGPYLGAVEAYEKSGRGDVALEARAAMLVFEEADPDKALKRLGRLRAAVRRAPAKHTTE